MVRDNVSGQHQYGIEVKGDPHAPVALPALPNE
jgi:hypothetical protein